MSAMDLSAIKHIHWTIEMERTARPCVDAVGIGRKLLAVMGDLPPAQWEAWLRENAAIELLKYIQLVHDLNAIAGTDARLDYLCDEHGFDPLDAVRV